MKRPSGLSWSGKDKVAKIQGKMAAHFECKILHNREQEGQKSALFCRVWQSLK
jgi:hypothetical protein